MACVVAGICISFTTPRECCDLGALENWLSLAQRQFLSTVCHKRSRSIREIRLRTGNDLCSGCSINRCAGSRAIGFLVGFGLVFLQGSIEGSDLIMLASSNDSQPMKLMVHSGIAGAKDLKGKTIAVTRFGSLTDLLLRPMLKNWGLDPQKDVKLLQIGRLPDMVLAIAQKKVDGGVISFPSSLQAEKMGVKTLLDFADSGLDIPSTTVVASRKYANAHRDTVLRFLKAYIEGTRRLLTDKELGIRALRKYGGVNDRELLTTTYDLFTSRYTKKVPKINPKTVETALSLLAEVTPKAKGHKAEEFIDTSFIDELEATGFIKSIWP